MNSISNDNFFTTTLPRVLSLLMPSIKSIDTLMGLMEDWKGAQAASERFAELRKNIVYTEQRVLKFTETIESTKVTFNRDIEEM